MQVPHGAYCQAPSIRMTVLYSREENWITIFVYTGNDNLTPKSYTYSFSEGLLQDHIKLARESERVYVFEAKRV